MPGLRDVIDKVLEKDWKAVTKASLSLLYANAGRLSLTIVSGWRSGRPEAENEEANDALRREIRSLDLGHRELEGHREEKEPEPLYGVFGLTKDQALRILASYHQDAVIYRERGPVLLLRAEGQADSFKGSVPRALTQAIAAWKGPSYVLEALPGSFMEAVGYANRLGRIGRRGQASLQPEPGMARDGDAEHD